MDYIRGRKPSTNYTCPKCYLSLNVKMVSTDGPPPDVSIACPHCQIPLSPTVLSLREIEVVRLLASGKKVSVAATELFVSVKTIENHRAHIYEKLSLANLAGLTRYAIKHGLVSLED